MLANPLPTEYFGNMLNVVIPDTRHADLAELEKSVRTPGLVERILEYRDRMRSRSGKKSA